jgi:hypothetical protein
MQLASKAAAMKLEGATAAWQNVLRARVLG